MDRIGKHAHWLLRLAIASVFLFHGLAKLPTLAAFASMLKMPWIVALAVALCESLGGILIILGGVLQDRGLATRLGSILIIPVMLTAMFMVHWGQWSFMSSESHPMGGIEFHVVLLAVLFYFLIKGKDA